jgi:hypothetical protein
MAHPSKLPESQPAADAGAARRPAPCWDDVVEVIERLAVTGAVLPTSLGLRNQIASYQRGRRLMLDSAAGSHWVAVDDIRECWKTFERLGRIGRQDVLEPGRRSAFMVALFAQVPGVVERSEPEHHLVLPV